MTNWKLGAGSWKLLAASVALAALAGHHAAAQNAPPADWLTDGGDAQRTFWQKNEHIVTTANVKNMVLRWKYHTDNEARQLHNLFPPLIVGRVNTPSGPKQLAIVAGISDNLYAIDVATGQLQWKVHFDSTFLPGPATSYAALCPGGLTATPVIGPTSTLGQYIAYSVSWDGRLHRIDVGTGREVVPSDPFIVPNGKPYSLNMWNNVVYAATAQGCGGTPNLLYAFDLATRRVSTFDPGSGGMWGRSGPSIGSDGLVFEGTGDGTYAPELRSFGQAIIAAKLDPQTKLLKLADYYGPPNTEFLLKRDMDMQVTGPVFNYKGHEFIVQSSKECRLWLLDTHNMGGEDHRTADYYSPLLCNEDQDYQVSGVYGSMATWEDQDGTRWFLTPFWGPKHPAMKFPIEHGDVFYGAVAAFKVEGTPGQKMTLTPAWVSRDMNHADPPVIANGIVFGYASGEDQVLVDAPAPAGAPVVQRGTAGRIKGATHAELFALDARTGATLWSSGDQITSWNHFSGISFANGRVYIATFDGTVYCFGLPDQP